MRIILCIFFLLRQKKGVGKTSLTHLIANNEALTSPGWTVGCAVEVKLHEYKEGTPAQHTFFIELWDIGGSISHTNTRGVFYNPVHGIILVHDLTNRKSHENLQQWIYEILNKDGKDVNKSSTSSSLLADDFDPEQFLGSTQVSERDAIIIILFWFLCENGGKFSLKIYRFRFWLLAPKQTLWMMHSELSNCNAREILPTNVEPTRFV